MRVESKRVESRGGNISSKRIVKSLKVAFFNFPEEKKKSVISFLEKDSSFSIREVSQKELEYGRDTDIIFFWTDDIKGKNTKIKIDEMKDKFRDFPVILIYDNSREISQSDFLELGSYGVKDFVSIKELYRLPFIIEREAHQMRSLKFSKFYFKWLQEHDVVSDFLKRYAFLEKIQRIISEDEKITAGVFVINIRYFDTMIMHFGRTFGDAIINFVAEKIRKISNPEDILGRISENRFAVFRYAHCDDKNECILGAREFAVKLIKEIAKHTVIEGKYIKISIDIGISFYPFDGTTADDLIKAAEITINELSAKSGDNYGFFSKTVKREIMESTRIIGEIFSAIKNGSFFLVFQPVFSVQDTRIRMFEALLRWKGRIVNPESVVKLAESVGAIYELNKLIIKEVIETASYLPKYVFSLNLSPNHLDIAGLYDEFMSLLEKYGVPPSRICIEISEKSSFDEIHKSLETIRKFAERGVKIAVDDFGAGQSSITHLRELPADMVKIDREIIRRAVFPKSFERYIVEAVSYLVRKSGKTLVAEGVETEKEFKMVKETGFDLVQGFYLSQPLVKDEILHLI